MGVPSRTFSCCNLYLLILEVYNIYCLPLYNNTATLQEEESITHRSRTAKTSAYVKSLQEARVDATAIAASILQTKFNYTQLGLTLTQLLHRLLLLNYCSRNSAAEEVS